MKLADKTKKRLVLAGLGVVCIALVIAIASQFKTEEPNAVSAQPSSTVSDAVNPSAPPTEQTNTQGVNTKPIEPAVTPNQSTDTGNSTGTEQSIQAEVTKPTEPPQEAKTNPSQKPDGEKVTKPENSTAPSTPKAGDKNDKGQMWFPGFGWVDDGGANEGTKAGDMYENGNKIGDMN